MRFELVPKTKATLVDVDIQSVKVGQTDVNPAVALMFKTTRPNAALNMLDKSLLGFLFQRGSPGGQKQSTLDGVEVVSDMPALTPAAMKLGVLPWDEEQTGSKLSIYQGVTGDHDINLKDGTVEIKKIDPKEGGGVDLTFRFYTTAVDAEVMGELGVLKSHELDIELTAAQVVKQAKLEDDKPKGGKKADELTPEKALAKSLEAEKA